MGLGVLVEEVSSLLAEKRYNDEPKQMDEIKQKTTWRKWALYILTVSRSPPQKLKRLSLTCMIPSNSLDKLDSSFGELLEEIVNLKFFNDYI